MYSRKTSVFDCSDCFFAASEYAFSWNWRTHTVAFHLPSSCISYAYVKHWKLHSCKLIQHTMNTSVRMLWRSHLVPVCQKFFILYVFSFGHPTATMVPGTRVWSPTLLFCPLNSRMATPQLSNVLDYCDPGGEAIAETGCSVVVLRVAVLLFIFSIVLFFAR